jgi:hypothetical protein
MIRIIQFIYFIYESFHFILFYSFVFDLFWFPLRFSPFFLKILRYFFVFHCFFLRYLFKFGHFWRFSVFGWSNDKICREEWKNGSKSNTSSWMMIKFRGRHVANCAVLALFSEIFFALEQISAIYAPGNPSNCSFASGIWRLTRELAHWAGRYSGACQSGQGAW